MLGHMGIVVIPRMTTPWKIVVVAVAVFGFVWGYVGTAGSADMGLPLAFGGRCASMGQCLQYTLDRGFPGFFYPAALVPGAGSALILGAVAYLLFLAVHGIRRTFHWQPAARGEKQPVLAEGLPSVASRPEAKQWVRRTPLALAVGLALIWAILSVGPSRFADDLLWVVPHDDVYAPDPTFGCTLEPHVPKVGSFEYGGPNVRDGMCSARWGGDASFLVDDVLSGGENGLLAFLAVGAALLLWPRLRAGMLESSPGRAALGAPTLDLGTSDQPAVGPGETVGDKLRQLAALRDDGIISPEEFEAKKVELLRAF